MTDFSRRSILKSSPLAAIALCMPKPWSQALSLDVSPPNIWYRVADPRCRRGVPGSHPAVACLHPRMRDGHA